MDNITTDFGDVLLWSFWFFIWIAALMVWFRCLFDLFGDRSLSGWAKAGWAILLVVLPWIGALIWRFGKRLIVSHGEDEEPPSGHHQAPSTKGAPAVPPNVAPAAE